MFFFPKLQPVRSLVSCFFSFIAATLQPCTTAQLPFPCLHWELGAPAELPFQSITAVVRMAVWHNPSPYSTLQLLTGKLFIFHLKLIGSTPEDNSSALMLQHPAQTHTRCNYVHVEIIKGQPHHPVAQLYFLATSQLQCLFFLHSGVLWCSRNYMHKSQQLSVFFGVCLISEVSNILYSYSALLQEDSTSKTSSSIKMPLHK